MKKNLLQIVQSVMNDMDSDKVNSIGDTVESDQIANVCQDVFYDIIKTMPLPEHDTLVKLVAMSSSDYPNYLDANNVSQIKQVKYNISTETGGLDYKEIYYLPQDQFLQKVLERNSLATEVTQVADPVSGIKLPILNDRFPTYYTSFNDRYLCFDSFNSTVDTTLQTSKTLVFGTVFPTFVISDTYVPQLDDNVFPYYVAECKSRCFSLFKGGPDAKIEQFARKNRYFLRADRDKVKTENRRVDYGRKRK